MLTVLHLLACGGDPNQGPPPDMPPQEPPAEPTPPPAEPTPATTGESRTFELDAPGGTGGAPDGAAFIVPGGAQAEVFAGPLDGGAAGMRLTAKAEGDALACTQSVRLGPTAQFATRMKVTDVKAGPQAWMGMNVELRARDDNGALVSPAGTRYVLIRNERFPNADWVDVDVPVSVPTGATNGEFCFRFVNSTGTVQVDRVVINGGGGAASSDVASAPATPVTRWDLDAPGGPGGAPMGFEFLVPPGTQGTTATAGPVDGGTGFKFAVSQASNSLACSQPVPVTGPMRVGARVKVADIKADARAWTGFTAEVRTYDGAGQLVSPAGSQFITVATLKSAGDWQELAKSFTAPTGAATAKLCFRFVESTGSAEVDWAEAG